MGRTGTGRRGTRLLLALAALLSGTVGAAAAKLVAVEGREQRAYGRIALTFDQSVKVTAKVSGTVLLIGFREPATGLLRERLAAEMPAYIAQVRRDPDGTGLRLALQKPYRVNVLEAAERVFIDLVPESWTGLLPALPPEVVADLARRAEEAEARLRREAARAAKPVLPLPLEVAQLPTLTRFTLRLPPGAEVALERAGRDLRLRVDGSYAVQIGEARARLKPAVEALSAETTPEAARFALTLAEGHEAETYRDEDGYTLDILKPGERRAPEPLPAAAKAEPARAPVAETPGAPAKAEPARPEPVRMEPPVAPLPSGPVEARITRAGEAVRIVFPFAQRPAAALFERGGSATLVFEGTAPLRLDPTGLATGAVRLAEAPRHEGGHTVLRFALDGGLLAQLAAGEGQGWTLVFGDGGVPAGDLLAPRRIADGAGRPAVALPLARPGQVLWLDRDGERIAVVTAQGPRIAGVPKRGRFVDFDLLASRQGVAVLALADDLVVRPGLASVVISRPGGVAVSPVPADGADSAPPLAATSLVVQPERWREDRRGDVRARIRAAQDAIARADRPGRSAARIDLARVLLANGFDAEAATVLAFAAKEDAVTAVERPTRILSAIAAVRLRRDAQAAAILGGDTKLGQDPEARLWRAMLDARSRPGAGPLALAAFKAGMPVIEAYPEELQLPLLLATASVALDARDLTTAQQALAAAAPIVDSALTRDQVALLNARLAGALGETGAARREYQRLAEAGERPVAAEAILHLVDLGRGAGTLARAEALDRLEQLAVAWHGGDIEAETLARLSHLYAEAGRWRDAFVAARKANRLFPDHPATRSLHPEMVGLFADLFLTDKGASLGRVEALALYFDFKEFTPVNRQGDEIVRGLVDRLVGLDLLDAAGELLQHQVDKRLTGAARASVAARLAAIRLMDERPLQALQVLHATRLPELPARIRDARMLLEARALSDLSRTDLALELLDGMEGPDAARLRADILWGARRWREAGEAHEALLGTRWREPGPLTEAERADVMRAAIAYALADESLSLDRLRTKTMPKMAESADARAFGLLSAPGATATAAFRDLAGRAISAETLTAFLKAFRERYPESAVPPRPAAPADAAPGTNAQAGGTAPPG